MSHSDFSLEGIRRSPSSYKDVSILASKSILQIDSKNVKRTFMTKTISSQNVARIHPSDAKCIKIYHVDNNDLPKTTDK